MEEIPWPRELENFVGSPILLSGIPIFYDFDWFVRFGHSRAAFPKGKPLTARAGRQGNGGKIPALLLTRIKEEKYRTLATERYQILVVKIDKYLASTGDAADAFFGKGADVDLANLASDRDLTASQIRLLIDNSLEPDGVAAWAKADPARVKETVRLLVNLEGGAEAAVKGREQDVLKSLHDVLGEEFWDELQRAGVDLPEALAHREVWKFRQSALAEFQEHLVRKDWKERRWQTFFESNHWIFGRGLSHQFLWQIEAEPNLGGHGISGKGDQKSDFLLATAATIRFTVLVEIKTPETLLLESPDSRSDAELPLTEEEAISRPQIRGYRNRTFSPSRELAGAVAQVQQGRWRWAVKRSRDREVADELEARRIYTYAPHGVLVIGNSDTLEGNRDKIRNFEVFRRSLSEPEILTFDELFARAEQVVTNGLGEKPG